MEASAKGVSVLVIDDDAGVRTLVCETLRDAGFDVITAESGPRGMDAMAANPPALVISDVQMPGTSGYEVCRRVRQEWGDVPFMFLSGTRTESYDRVAGFEFGADDYVTKPFDPEELVARVRALLRRSRGRVEHVTAPSHGLTERELEILGLLARGFTQSDIARDLVVSPKTVGKHIERILKKLGVHSRAEAVAVAYRDGLVADAAA